jgi:stage II sporulation protein AA (anti-sigma F factor antagonist)
MAVPSACRWFDVEQVDQVTVARFPRPVALEGEGAEAVAEQLSGLVLDSGCCRLVLNLANVETLSSAMLGKLIWLHKRALPLGGRLALCHVDPKLEQILDTVKLSVLIGVYADEKDAIRSFVTAF